MDLAPYMVRWQSCVALYWQHMGLQYLMDCVCPCLSYDQVMINCQSLLVVYGIAVLYVLFVPLAPAYGQVVVSCLSLHAAYEIVALYGMWTSCMHALYVRWVGPSAGVACMHYMLYSMAPLPELHSCHLCWIAWHHWMCHVHALEWWHVCGGGRRVLYYHMKLSLLAPDIWPSSGHVLLSTHGVLDWGAVWNAHTLAHITAEWW